MTDSDKPVDPTPEGSTPAGPPADGAASASSTPPAGSSAESAPAADPYAAVNDDVRCIYAADRRKNQRPMRHIRIIAAVLADGARHAVRLHPNLQNFQL